MLFTSLLKMAAIEEDFDIVSEADSEEMEALVEEEDLDEDFDDEVEEDVEVDEEEDAEVDEEKLDEEEEEVDEIEEEEEVEEEEEDEDDEEFLLKDLYQDDDPIKATRRHKTRIERYCKSLNETCPREIIDDNCLPSVAFSVLKQITSEKNATAFSSFVESKKDLYQLCGKMMTKEISNKELYQEVKKGVREWDSILFKQQRAKEALEIRILTTKMDVVEGLYACRRCGSQKTYSRQVQTRSADEGMTSIIQCSKCSLVWREYA